MSKLIKLTEKDLSNLVKKTLKEQMEENANYMFFSNLEQIKRHEGEVDSFAIIFYTLLPVVLTL